MNKNCIYKHSLECKRKEILKKIKGCIKKLKNPVNAKTGKPLASTTIKNYEHLLAFNKKRFQEVRSAIKEMKCQDSLDDFHKPKGQAKFWEDLKSGKFAMMVKRSSRGMKISNALEAYNILKPVLAEKDDVESLYCVFLNNANRILSIEKMFSGSIRSASIYPREIIKRVIELKATSVVMSHNHPGGNSKPSSEDRELTFKMKMILSAIDVNLYDHIIIGDSYYSLANEGLW